jgi:hypothetical protein
MVGGGSPFGLGRGGDANRIDDRDRRVSLRERVAVVGNTIDGRRLAGLDLEKAAALMVDLQPSIEVLAQLDLHFGKTHAMGLRRDVDALGPVLDRVIIGNDLSVFEAEDVVEGSPLWARAARRAHHRWLGP